MSCMLFFHKSDYLAVAYGIAFLMTSVLLLVAILMRH